MTNEHHQDDKKKMSDQIHDSKRYGETNTVNVEEETSTLDTGHLTEEGDKPTSSKLPPRDLDEQSMSQSERHEREQEANNGDDSSDKIAKLAGDRRGMRQDS